MCSGSPIVIEHAISNSDSDSDTGDREQEGDNLCVHEEPGDPNVGDPKLTTPKTSVGSFVKK